MTSSKQIVERRKQKRFQVPPGTFVALFPDYIRAGPVLDLSMGGLAFTYMSEEKPPNGLFELEIILPEQAFHLQGVPFSTISDFVREDVPSGYVTVRRCGVQFGELTDRQKHQLEYFIQNIAIGEVV
jgi:c-di-GMP-binding flagellar brake protein YcgR